MGRRLIRSLARSATGCVWVGEGGSCGGVWYWARTVCMRRWPKMSIRSVSTNLRAHALAFARACRVVHCLYGFAVTPRMHVHAERSSSFGDSTHRTPPGQYLYGVGG